MSDEFEGERRHNDKIVGEKLARIEIMLEGIKETISEKFIHVISWQNNKEKHCIALEAEINKLKIEQAKQLVNNRILVLLGSCAISGIFSWVFKKF